MPSRLLRAAAALLIVLTAVACGPAAGSPSATPHATTFTEFTAAYCASWDALFKAVGNPDTGSGSILSKSPDQAVAAHDAATAERIAADIRNQLETGRQQASMAAEWPSARPMMVQMDRLFVAFEMMTAAKRAAAGNPARPVDAQAAFEQAGGVEAWTAMFEAGRGLARPSGAPAQSCPSVPVSV
jgi:hypothetical protein